MSQNIVCLGASSKIAEETLRLYSSKDNQLVLVGRDQVKLDVVKQDLMSRNPSQVHTIIRDFADLENLEAFVEKIINLVGKIDILLIAYGTLSDQQKLLKDKSACLKEMTMNYISPICYTNAFLVHFQKQNSGTIAIISSVAGDRGRATNIIYGSAKAGLNAYTEALGQKLASTNVCVSLIKPGMVATPMIEHLGKSGMLVAEPENVAVDIYRGIERKSPVIYTPKFWFFIMNIIKLLPSFIFRKLKF